MGMDNLSSSLGLVDRDLRKTIDYFSAVHTTQTTGSPLPVLKDSTFREFEINRRYVLDLGGYVKDIIEEYSQLNDIINRIDPAKIEKILGGGQIEV